MSDAGFPNFIRGWAEADVPLTGVRGWISQAADHQIVFFDIEPIGEIPPHSHGEQWGIVVDGEMELTIDGESCVYRKGDAYHIPAGAVHGAVFRTHFRTIDVFADRDRYHPRP